MIFERLAKKVSIVRKKQIKSCSYYLSLIWEAKPKFENVAFGDAKFRKLD